MGVMRLLFYMYLIGIQIGEDPKTNIIRHMFKIDWTTSSHINKYSPLNSETLLGGPIYLVKKSTDMHFP